MDPISLFMVAVLGLLIYFMIRNSRKQRRTQQEMAEKLRPGVEVMTTFGLFATLKKLDDENNMAFLDVGKGVTLRIHRQAITKVVEDQSEETTTAPGSASEA
jgi:preprotein translocase subunit YajC